MKQIAGVLKQDWYILLIILASILLGAYFYPQLPQKVPIHCDSSGNEVVWQKTHRVAGSIWVLGGIANLILTLLGGQFEVIGLIVILVIIAVVPVAYSYLSFRKIKING